MKKFIITTCAILMMSVTANACGGIAIKGKSGADYCLSKHTMNWYSAYAWCNDQKLRLIDMGSVCKSSSSCPELKLSDDEKKHITDNGGTVGWVWTNRSGGAGDTPPVHLTTGGTNYISCHSRNCSGGYALCF
ncbi:MAG: hypothetical protein IKY98_02990 [Alphaproteobacteria bacterium]|nr:hypothetical protein [Alphaproteobacteria bacterium]